MRVTIDDATLEVGEGTTILQAVRDRGGEVPTLCDDARLSPFGACRVCLVAVEGMPAPVPSCTTPCREGMVIDTTDALARRVASTVVELVLSELPGPPAPHTELARIAASLGVRRTRFAGARHDERHDERHPYLALWHELCISCGRCVRACDEVQGAFALTATGRGFHANVTAGLDAGFEHSSCVSCGACADTCPTDAITERTLLDIAAAGPPEGPQQGAPLH
ncbi:MAG: (2Fe-2S)-binding protein [Acidobacteriota bacterium]|nr:(2Fe-2S)-binding protein [Acidobacteriota bacterium]